MDIEIDVRELAAMARNYANAQAIVTQELGKGLTRGAMLIQADARRMAPVNTGYLKNNILVEAPSRVGDAVVVKVGPKSVKYARYVEFGTRPHFVPAKYIGPWMAKHGISGKGIYVSGKPRPYLVPAFEMNKLRAAQFIRQAAVNAMRRIGGGR